MVNKRLNNIISLSVPLVFIIAGLTLEYLLLTQYSFYTMLERTRWRETYCTVMRSEIKKKTLKWEIPGITKKGQFMAYQAIVKFRYNVDEQEYVAEWFDVRGGPLQWFCTAKYDSATRKKAEETIEKYPKEMETVCYVNPKNPKEAVLHNRMGIDLIVGLLTLPLFIVLAGCLITFTQYNQPLRKKQCSPVTRKILRGTSFAGMIAVLASIGILISYTEPLEKFHLQLQKYSEILPQPSAEPEDTVTPSPEPIIKDPYVDGTITGIVDEKKVIVKKQDTSSLIYEIDNLTEFIPPSWRPAAGENVRIYCEPTNGVKLKKIIRGDYLEKTKPKSIPENPEPP